MKKWKRPKIKHNRLTRWNWMVGHPEGLTLGKHVDIGAFTYINARYGVYIYDNVQIGSHCSIYSHNSINNHKEPIVIGNNAKIGSHSILLPGIVIEPNELIKAFSIVYLKERKRVIKVGSIVR